MEADPRWRHHQTLAAGQVAEFKVWAELVRQSLGGLHVFLPVRDLGIDGVMHRLADGAYIAVQVKCRSELTAAGQVHITVTASSLVDDEALIVATLSAGPELGELVLVVDEKTFRALAAHDTVDGREYLTAAFEMHAEGSSRWAPYLVPRERLVERFGVAGLAAVSDALLPPLSGADRGREGLLGETEVIRRLAEADSLALFRPFPDLETVEVLCRHMTSRRYLGLQVKTAGWDAAHPENRVHFRRSSFRPAASTFVCVLSWDRAGRRFGDGCLLIPSAKVEEVAAVEGEWLVLELQPGSERHRRLDEYRTPLVSLGATVQGLIE
ncbi:MAG TPA: hypothetical protein VLU92_14180 [Candidatus Dormibacteraeota bacterium]|nr:hypothetical protein [Candidatus Dormibacteraeota bacterium]